MTKREKLALLLKQEHILKAPAAFDALSAKMIELAGFDAVWVSGASLTNALLGCPDVGIASYGEILTTWQHINAATSLPVIVDADTGFGGTFNTRRMVQDLEMIGIAGLQIEDQTFPKRCGYFAGVGVVSLSEMEKRLNAVLKARTDPNLLVIARTDAIKSEGIDAAMKRVERFYEMGADMVFLAAPKGPEHFERMAQSGLPMACDVIEETFTGTYTAEQMEKYGFKIIKYPQTLIRATMKAMKGALDCIAETGGTISVFDQLATSAERNFYTGKDELEQFEAALDKNE